MKQFAVSFQGHRRLLSKHKLIVAMLITLCTICFLMLGQIIDKALPSMENIDEFTNTLGKANYYYLHENFDEVIYYRYLSEEDYKFGETVNFVNEMIENKHFTYISACQQPIEIMSGLSVPEKCLYGYESGNAKDSVYEDEMGRIMHSAQACQITKSVVDFFSISIDKGSMFKENDFAEYLEKIPVLLGSSYKNKGIEVGDSFQGFYLYEQKDFVVIGFIEKDTYFSNGNTVFYFDNLIVFPQVVPLANDSLKYNKLRLLQMLNGTIISNEPFSSVCNSVQETLQKTNAPSGKNAIFVTDNNDENSDLDTLLLMTNRMYKQYKILVITLCIFLIVAISVTINGFVRENYYELGVYMLVGSYIKTLNRIIVLAVIGVVLSADILAVFILMLSDFSYKSLIYMQFVVLITIILSSVFPIVYLKHIKLNELLGGKE